MNLKELNKFDEELDKMLNEVDARYRYLNPSTEEQTNFIDNVLDDFWANEKIKSVTSGNFSTFNPHAKKWLNALKNEAINSIKYFKEKGFNKEEILDKLNYLCTELIYETIPLSEKTNFGDYAPNEIVIHEILTDKDYKWLEEQNTLLENKFPYDEYKSEFDVVYAGAGNKIIHYFKDNIESWYDEV